MLAMQTSRWFPLVVLLLAAFAAAGIGGAATARSVGEWYPLLHKPAWNPPSWVFGPAWTLLYVLMSVAAWRIWLRRAEPGAVTILRLHGVQLVANALWSVLFFGFRRPDLALVEVFVLWLLLANIQFRLVRQDRVAALLWSPYLAWVTFAAALNAAVWALNRG